MTTENTSPSQPTPPIELTPPADGPVTAHYGNEPVEVPEELLATLAAICEVVSVDDGPAGADVVAEAFFGFGPVGVVHELLDWFES